MRYLAAIVLCTLPLAAPAQTEQEERDRGFLTGLIEDNLSGVSRQVIIEGFEGALSSRATIAVLTIADAEGIWFRAEGLAFEWDRSAVLRGRIDVQEMSAESISLLRPPISEPQPPNPEAAPFALPELPVGIEIDDIRADTITLGAPLLGEEIVLSLDGAVSLANGAGVARIVADRLNGDGQFVIEGGYSNVTRNLDLSLDLSEDQGGLVVRLLDLSGRPSVDLTIDGSGPIDNFAADLTLATAGVQRLTGQFGLVQRTDEIGQNRLDVAFDLGGDVGAMLPTDYAEFFGNDVSLSLRIERAANGAVSLHDLDVDAEALRLQGSADLSPDGWPLRLDLGMQVAFRDGSPVLLPLSGERTFITSSDLTVSYDQARGDSWTGQFDIRDLQRPGLTIPRVELAGGGSIVPRTVEAPGSFSVDLDYVADDIAIDDPGLARAIGNRIAGTLELARDGDAPFEISQFTLTGPGIDLTADGTIQGPDSGFGIKTAVQLQADALDRFSLLTGLAGLRGAAALTIAAEAQPLTGGFDVSLSGSTADLELGISALDPLLTGAGQIALAADRDETGTRLSALTIQTPLTELTAEADLSSAGSNGSFDLLLRDVSQSLPGLRGEARLDGTFEQDAEGLVSLAADATVPGTTAQITASIPPSETTTIVQADVALQTADLAPYSALAGRDLAGALDLDARGFIQSNLAQFDLTLDLQGRDLAIDINRLDPLLAGPASLTGRIFRTDPQSLGLEGISLSTPALEADVSGTFANGAGQADFGVQLADIGMVEPRLSGQAMFAGAVSRDGAGTLNVDALATGPGGAVASIKGALPTGDGAQIDGRVIASVADLAPYSQLAGRNLSGSLDTSLSGQAATDLSRFNLDFDLAGRELVAGGIGLPGGVTATGQAERTVDGGTLTLDATGPGGTSITLSADAVDIGETFDITTDLSLEAESIASYSGLVGRSLSGGASLSVGGTLRADVTAFDLSVEGETRNLDVGIAPLATLMRGTGTFRTRASRGPSGGVTLQGVRIAYPNFTAAGSLEARDGAGSGAFNARLADIGLFTADLSGPVTAQGTASLGGDGRWSTQTTATGPGGIRADIGGSFAGNDLNLQVAGVAPLGLANAYIEPRRLQGDAIFDLSINGPAALSSVSGQVTLPGARLADPALARAVEDLRGSLTLNGGQAAVDLSGRLESGGDLSVSGQLGLTGARQADLLIVGRDIVERDPNLYETTINARLTVTGPLSGGALIGGLVTLGDTEIQVPSSDLSSLGDLPDVRHVGADGAVRQTLSRAGVTPSGADVASGAGSGGGGGGGAAYPLDITVEAPARMFVRGRGLDAELGGALRLTGTTRQVIPAGQFSLIRGRIDILQQRFALDEGSITLQGDFVPFIRLVATTTARDGTAISIIIEGPASEPVVRFTSQPELPQDEVLARLIFDQPLSEISPLQAVQLAAAVSTLAGRGGAGLIGNFRTELGLDDLDITTDEDGGVAVRAGKYLSENVYTDVTVGSDRTEIELNLDLTDDVTITGRANSDGETGLGIFFERDY